MRVLVLSQKHNRGALVAVRDMARRGWIVGSGSAAGRGSLAASSVAVSHRHAVPPPQQDLDGFLDAVADAVETVGYDVVLPGSDADTLALSFGRERIPRGLRYPEHELVVAAFDKLRLADAARTHALGTPTSRVVTDDVLETTRYPVVVKSRLHWQPGAAHFHWRTAICSSPEEARSRSERIRAGGGEPILQESVEGRLLHYQLVLDIDGHVMACTAQRSEPDALPPYTSPPVVGTRVRSVSVPFERRILDALSDLLRDLGWVGFASFMFIEPAGGEPLLVDFNGRIPNSFQQSLSACPDLLELWVRVAAGERGLLPIPSRVGAPFHWLEGDVRRALRERRGGLVGDLRDVIAYARGVDHGLFTWRDPGPACRYWCQLAKSKVPWRPS